MPEDKSTTGNPDPSPPLTDQLISMRDKLSDIFVMLDITLDVVITCRKALDVQNVEQDGTIANVLRIYGSDQLDGRLEELSELIEHLGGRTRFTDERENAAFDAAHKEGGTNG